MLFFLFIVGFMMLVFMASIFVCGWFYISRHWIVVQPNGDEKVEGDLLKWFSYYIEKVKKTERLYYIDEPLKHKYSELIRLLPKMSGKIELSYLFDAYTLTVKQELSEKEKSDISAVLSCQLYFKGDVLHLYVEEPIYYVPDLIRKPLSSCYKCMASAYGTVIYFTVCSLMKEPFAWSSNPEAAKFIFLIPFLIILFTFNCVIGKKMIQYV